MLMQFVWFWVLDFYAPFFVGCSQLALMLVTWSCLVLALVKQVKVLRVIVIWRCVTVIDAS